MVEISVIRAEIQAQIIECLNRFYAIETGMWGGPLDALIVRTVVVGKLEGKFFDISAISATLDIPIATVHRKVINLERLGLIQRRKSGRSVTLIPTEKAHIDLDKSFEEMITTLRRLYQGKRRFIDAIPGNEHNHR